MNETANNEFTELLLPAPRADERTVLPFEAGVYCLALTSLAIQFGISSCIPCLVERGELTVFDEGTYLLLAG